MRAWLRGVWEELSASFWLVPSLMAIGAVALAAATVSIDAGPIGAHWARSVGWLWSGSAEGARSLLSTVASSVITVTGTVFSITIAALTLASSQFGPRLLRNFTRDNGNRVVLGTFVATFLYCLLVLRTVRGQSEGDFVPSVSVSVAVLFTVASVGVLIYFIHHVSSSIQAENIVAAIGADLAEDIRRLCPEGAADRPAPALPRAAARLVHAASAGYVQNLDRGSLVALAEEARLLIRVVCRPGDFAARGAPLLQVWRAPDEPDQDRDAGLGTDLPEELAARLRRSFNLGPRRTPTQDIRYGVLQLTEIAVRALSPGINDPMTAMGCADWLGDALGTMAERVAPCAISCGAAGDARLIETPVGFTDLVRLSFAPISEYGAASPMVAQHLLAVLADLAARVERVEFRAAVVQEAEAIAAAALAAQPTAGHARLRACLAAVRDAAAARPDCSAGAT